MTEMLYTIGHKNVYDKALASNPSVRKMGRNLDMEPPYPGGCVFEKRIDAHFYIWFHDLDEYDVYGVLTDIENTAPSSGELYRHLINDAEVVALLEVS